jgi:metallophosphoesterase (TIGR03767 family)
MQPPTTLDRVLRRGGARGAGTERRYHALVWERGEPRVVRRDLMPGDAVGGPAAGDPASLLFFAHLCDPQIGDVQSPGRFEFFEAISDVPEAELFILAARPQEALNQRAVEALVRTVNRLGESPESGAPLALVLSAGDNLDNAQANELEWFLTMMTGGEIDQRSGGAVYEGVQDADWKDPTNWHPDPVPDRYRERWGFPDHPGLLAEAMTPFRAEGLALPWLTCYGNHDGLALGNSLPTAAYREIVVGDRKAVALPPGFDAIARQDEFNGAPELFLAGPARTVTGSAARRIVGRPEVLAAVAGAPGLPAGHGLSPADAAAGIAWCVHDLDEGPVPVRFVFLDTTNMDGFYEGSIGRRQLRWLEDRLAEVSSRHLDPGGRWVQAPAARDHLVVLMSHHSLEDLVNDRRDPSGFEDDQPRVLGAEVEALVHRFPNVVLWANGHRHVNKVWARPDTTGRSAGFWEVSTSAVSDWPCQMRLFELTVGAGGTLAILATMLDADVPADPAEADGLARLAALHRQLAANDPFCGLGSYREGQPDDRNAVLLLPAPFAIA